ncbi:MAG: 30S ribosomal protein S12 methylthiotransferase RimO [Thiotrichaceae bacterium]|nr:30S ribosomal protein S12 methylthiotransferase RimO [Thiotrichaceae bacterium]PCI13485.1 MAG: 30S ribosomal protein S12 methylthiotransferase RimO [Thiotrichales bacterium]
MSQTPAKIGFVSLGCPKALVDSEQIITRLRAEGYEISPSYDNADMVVVNTCGFIDAAIEESLDAIGEALNENGKVIVTGCLGAQGNTIQEQFPEVLAVTGPHAAHEVMEAVHAHLPPLHHPYTSLVPPQGIKLTPKHYAYLKISEGCNHRCTFCIIPSLRGDLLSRPVGEVMQEAENLVNAGVRELLVISQDTSAYGVDTRYKLDFWNGTPIKTQFLPLVEALAKLDVWVRLHYVYPYPHVDNVIPLMAEGKILPYLDIPFQHASPSILKAMKRPAHTENTLERIRKWRSICPDIALRSTFVVGFPGETESDFNYLLDFMHEAQLDRVGAFAYSPVDGATANALPNPIPEEIKQERLEKFMAVQAEISAGKRQMLIGSKMVVIVDEVSETGIVARSQADAPAVDGIVRIPELAELQPGDFVEVTITDADEHDLVASLITDE